jgi:hypothetical protein
VDWAKLPREFLAMVYGGLLLGRELASQTIVSEMQDCGGETEEEAKLRQKLSHGVCVGSMEGVPGFSLAGLSGSKACVFVIRSPRNQLCQGMNQ